MRTTERILGLLGALSVAVFGACAGPPEGGGGPNDPSALIGSLAVPDTPLSAVWVLRTSDCFACPGIDVEYRRLSQVAHAAGFPLPLVVLHIGTPRDTLVVRAHLRAARIDGTITTRTPRELRRGGTPPSAPDLWLLVDGEPEWRLSEPTEAGVSPESFMRSLNSDLGAGTAGSNPIHRTGTEHLPAEPVDPEPRRGMVLWFGSIDVPDAEQFGVVGRVGECLAAFRMTSGSGTPQAWVVPPEAFASDHIRITTDSVYDPQVTMTDEWAREQEWRPLPREEALSAFTGCLP